MESKLISPGVWEVLGDSGKIYIVTTTSCTCANFIIRLRGVGECKHMKFVNTQQSKAIDTTKILAYITSHGTVFHDDLSTEFGDVDEAIRLMLREGQIWTDKPGQYKIL